MGLISKTFSWMTEPLNDDRSINEWLAGLLLVLILAFLWSTVIKMIE